ncbi:MAG TPA: alcohol acetyltransferase [Bacilli bacterium]
MNKWYKLDNAAKIFPSVTSDKRTNVFRLSVVLTEEVNPELLKEALNLTIIRFPSLKVKMKKGLFWYYLEENNAEAVVYPESSHICQRLKGKENNGYLFKLSYYSSRINLEVFHSLTDGTGALEFLKAIVFNYLLLTGKKLDSENLILTSDIENVYEEAQDSFVKNYRASLKSNKRDPKALQFQGNYYDDLYLSVITGEVSVSKLKEVAHKYSATITEFLTACLIFAAKDLNHLFKSKDKPFQVFVPVNLRKYFSSRTLRNFSLFISAGMMIDEALKFEDILERVKAVFETELQKEKLQERIVANVTIEKNIFLRIVPLVLKELVLKIGYSAWGDKLNSMTFSNIGVVKIPKSMEPYVRKFIFINGASKTSPVNLGGISYQDRMQVTFAGAIRERDLQREFFRLLASFGLEVIIETNELEV